MSGDSLNALLPLRSDCLAAPTRLDLAVIEAFMLWPKDEGAREQALKTSVTEAFRPAIGSIDPSAVPVLFEIAASAPPLNQIHDQVRKGLFIEGTIAGRILSEAVGHYSLGIKSTLNDIKEIAVRAFPPPQHRYAAQTINNQVWPTFRSVAHFWAAGIDRLVAGDDRAFPCSVGGLAAFLSLSEAYRRLGESVRLAAKSPTILNPQESLRLPPMIEEALPKVEITFASNDSPKFGNRQPP